ncbi:hypothetical protein MMC22_006683 [Lobaria immixta]|nr:hypothetical protein [Lobaria immixta]
MSIRPELCMSNSNPKPMAQTPHAFAGGSWRPFNEQLSSPSVSAIRLITWNIDAQAQGGPLRMVGALRYLEGLINTFPRELPLIIFFQEMVHNDLKLLQAAPWVRARFALTDTDTIHWKTPYYGTTTLVDRRLPLARVFRAFYKDTQMDRDGLYVDIVTKPAAPNKRILRFCNTHLESLDATPPMRPAQFAEASQHLHSPFVHGGILAGDLNAMEPFDRTLHSTYGFKDAYLEGGGKEDSHEGYTWGYQSYAELQERFGCKRLDKVLFCGRVKMKGLQRIGIGVKVDEAKRTKMRSFGALEFVTDHYGLMADVTVE